MREALTIGILATTAFALSACGLLEPAGPPARAVGEVPGTAVPDAPLPRPQDPIDQAQVDPAAPDGPPQGSPLPGYTLAWHDEFDGTALDPASWNIDLGPWRSGLNAADAVEVSGGLLELITFTDAAGAHHAGHINTKRKFEGAFGYYEARVRFGDSYGQWCSFFLYPATIGRPVGDPANAGVEADVFEHREADGSGFDFSDYVQAGLNWDGFGADWKKVNLNVAHPRGAPLKGEWHTYSVLWTATGYTFYVDELPVFQTSAAVSHIPEPIYLTCEVWNASWAGYIPAAGYGSRETSTTGMEVDWVRVWTPVE